MEYIVPVQPAAFSVSPVTPTSKSADVIQHNLQPYQVVQATIADKGDGRVLLEMRGQQMWAQTNADVKTGQQLNLQVISTEPRLHLQIMPQGMEKHLLRLLNLFDHKPEFGARLQQMSNTLDAKATQHQLQNLASQLLGQRSVPSGVELEQAAKPLQDILTQLQTTSQNVRETLGKTLLQILPQLTQSGADAATAASPKQILAQMTNILAEILLNSLNSRPNVETNAAISALQLEQVLTPLLKATAGQKPAALLQQIHTLIDQLESTNILSNALPSETGTEKTQKQVQFLAVALMQALTQSIGNIQQQMATPPPRELSLLAQVLGLNFEGRLLNGEIETARNSLKGILLHLQNQEETPIQVRENSSNLLQQLELFQLCRARLAQDGILFLPLPFDFLHQGYALIEEHDQKERDLDTKPGRKCLSVTLNLALDQLGALNINMLFEQDNLFVRIRCASPETLVLLERTRQDLDTRLKSLGLQSLNVDSGAQDPAVALLERLSPDKAVLNTKA